MTRDGLVMMSDSRTNAGYDQVNVSRKMYSFVIEGKSVFVLLTSGNLSLSQSVMTILRQEFDEGQGLAAAESLYDASRVIGEVIRKVGTIDGASLRKDNLKFNVNIILGGQVKGERPGLYIVYPQGNPLRATKDSCFLQIGESKYGKPILDRGVAYDGTSLDEAAKYALLSMDATIRSNVTVGAPIDLTVYRNDELTILRQRRFNDGDPDLSAIHSGWETRLRRAVAELPMFSFGHSKPSFYVPKPKTPAVQIELDLKEA